MKEKVPALLFIVLIVVAVYLSAVAMDRNRENKLNRIKYEEGYKVLEGTENEEMFMQYKEDTREVFIVHCVRKYEDVKYIRTKIGYTYDKDSGSLLLKEDRK